MLYQYPDSSAAYSARRTESTGQSTGTASYLTGKCRGQAKDRIRWNTSAVSGTGRPWTGEAGR